MTSKKWYFLAAGLVVLGVVLALTTYDRLNATVGALRRFAMPGQAKLELAAGETTLYLEHRPAVVGESLGDAEMLEFRCHATDPAGKPVALDRPTSLTTYGTDDLTGQNLFDLRADVAGAYTVACEAPSRFVIAVGGGVGTQIVVLLLAALVPAGLGVLVLIVVLVRRGGQQRKARLAAQ